MLEKVLNSDTPSHVVLSVIANNQFDNDCFYMIFYGTNGSMSSHSHKSLFQASNPDGISSTQSPV